MCESKRVCGNNILIDELFCRSKEQQDLSISEEDIDKCSHNVEGEMFSFFGDTGHRYKNKYRSLMFNLKDPRNKASYGTSYTYSQTTIIRTRRE